MQTDSNRRPSLNPRWVLALGVTAVSFSAILVRFTLAPPTVTACYRLLITCLLLLPLAWGKRREAAAIKKGDLLLCLLAGIFLSFHFTFWFAALRLTSVSTATLLVNIHPLPVIFLSWRLLGEKFPLRALPWALAAAAGIVSLSWGELQLSGTLSGNILAAGGGLMLGGYYLVGRRVRPRIPAIATALLVYGASALLLVAYNLCAAIPMAGYSARDWLVFAALAAVPTILGHTLLNWSLRYLPASAVSISVLAEPVLATLAAIPLFGEVPGPLHLAGGILVLAGIGMIMRHS